MSLARRLPFFYGWLVVAVAMLASFLGSGLNNVNMGVVFKPMSEDLGWSRSLMAGAVAGGTMVGGLLTPFAGRLADQMGPRLLMPAGTAAMALLALSIAFVTEPWQFYATYIPGRAVAQTLVIGVVPMTAVANWFYLQRPRAIGLVTMSVPLGSSLLAVLYQLLINDSGWRTPFLVLSGVLFFLVVAPTAFLLRRQPEDLGLLPDGAPTTPAQRIQTPSGRRVADVSAEYSWTLGQAIRTPTMWLTTAALTLSTMASGGVAFNLVAYLTDMQMDANLAAGALGMYALAGAVGSAVWGFLAERMSLRVLSVGTLVCSAVTLVLLLVTQTPVVAYVFAALFGLTARGEAAMGPILIAHYFGRRSFGTISGFISPFNMAGLGIGPVLGAAAFDLTGSYQGIILTFIGSFALGALLIGLARTPDRPAVHS